MNRKAPFPFEYAPESYCKFGKEIYCNYIKPYDISRSEIAHAIGVKSNSYISHALKGDARCSKNNSKILEYLEQRKLEFEKRSESVG